MPCHGLAKFFIYRAIQIVIKRNVGNLFLSPYMNQSDDADKCQSHSFFISLMAKLLMNCLQKRKCKAKICSHEMPDSWIRRCL